MSHYRGQQPERSKRSHGFPVQIYTEVVDVGKSMSSTKKRIKWRFGWTESPEEQEVELIHSLVSGKKTVFEDGNEIHTQTSLLETKFNHAWHSHGLYVFRVEAHISMMEESQYFLSIDGIRFVDWQKKDVPRRLNEPNRGRYSSEEEEYRDDRGRGGQQQQQGRQIQSQPQQQQRRGVPGAAGPSRQPQQQQQQQQQQQRQQQQHQRQPQQGTDDDSTFDPFAPSAAQTNAYDPFAQAPAASPPAQTTAASKPRSRTASSGAEPQLFDQFDGPPTRPAASSSFDAFNAPSTGDPFASQAAPQTTNAGSSPGSFAAFPPAAAPGRPKAASADLLSMDFVGMSFNPAPPVPQQAPPAADAPAPPVPAAAPVPADPWTDAKLVNLDLSGKVADAAPTARPTAQAPSLNHLMGNPLAPSPFAASQFAPYPQQTQQTAAPQLAAQLADPFGAPALLPPSMAPRPVVPAVAPVMSKSAAISSMGAGPPPPNPFASMRPQNAGMMAPGMASPPAMPQFMGAMGARPLANPYAANAAAAPAQGGGMPGMPNRGLSIPPVVNPYGAAASSGPPKSSLDSIDWKS